MTQQYTDRSHGIPSSAYTCDYYINCCDGHEEFLSSRGEKLPNRLALALQLAELQPNMSVLDIGCGRGELLLHAARAGAVAWGIDYAAAAVTLARQATVSAHQVRVLQASSVCIPFAGDTVDRVFLLDVVEHLLPAELHRTLAEVRRVLKPGGRLIVHTMPNLWYYAYGYPLYRGVQRLRGKRLPRDPRARWAYHHVHVNEQTPTRLQRTMEQAGLHTKVWLQSTQHYHYESNPFVRWGMEFLSRVYPFRWIFCNDIFAVGVK